MVRAFCLALLQVADGCYELSAVLGVILGAMLVEWASWRWVFYVVTMMGVPIAIVSIWAVPAGAPHDKTASFRRLDLPGVSLITAAMVLFVYAVTSGPASGWGTANVIAPLIISIALAVAFFIVEYYLPKDMAALRVSYLYLTDRTLIYVYLQSTGHLVLSEFRYSCRDWFASLFVVGFAYVCLL